jgi:hypothetical protein
VPDWSGGPFAHFCRATNRRTIHARGKKLRSEINNTRTNGYDSRVAEKGRVNLMSLI